MRIFFEWEHNPNVGYYDKYELFSGKKRIAARIVDTYKGYKILIYNYNDKYTIIPISYIHCLSNDLAAAKNFADKKLEGKTISSNLEVLM